MGWLFTTHFVRVPSRFLPDRPGGKGSSIVAWPVASVKAGWVVIWLSIHTRGKMLPFGVQVIRVGPTMRPNIMPWEAAWIRGVWSTGMTAASILPSLMTTLTGRGCSCASPGCNRRQDQGQAHGQPQGPDNAVVHCYPTPCGRGAPALL